MSSFDAEAAYAALADARRDGAPEVRAFGELAIQTTLHVGDGGTFFCHVMERVAPGRWELWRLPGAVFAVRVGSKPAMWLDAGAIELDTTFGAFIPELAAEEIQSLDDAEVTCDFAMDVVGHDTLQGSRSEAVVQTPGSASIAVFRVETAGRHEVGKGLDAGGRVCAVVVQA